MFDADSFLNSSISGANDTVVVPVPEGEYTGIIQDVKASQWQSKDGTSTGVALDVTWLVEDEDVKAKLGRPTVTVRQGIMLDTTTEGGIDTGVGRNVPLGRLREAVGKNDPKEKFSFGQLPGLAATIVVKHRIDGENTYAEVKGVAKL